jgi:hypothetical protein
MMVYWNMDRQCTKIDIRYNNEPIFGHKSNKKQVDFENCTMRRCVKLCWLPIIIRVIKLRKRCKTVMWNACRREIHKKFHGKT